MDGPSPDTPPPIHASNRHVLYRLWRAVIRLWFAFSFRRIRVLHEERLNEPGPVLLAVSRRENFLDALILVAGFERIVRCLIPEALVRGLFQGLVARGLGMIRFRPENRESALEMCCSRLAEKAAIATFAGPATAVSAGSSGLPNAASIAVEAESRHAGLGLRLLPAHLFLPVGRTHEKELLIDIDQPVMAHECISRAGGAAKDQVQELARCLESRCEENSFRLRRADLEKFLRDVEQALRDDIQEERDSPLASKQSLEGFQLSGFVVQWAGQINYLHPGLLVSLHESLDVWREARRLGALHRLETDTAGAWLNSAPGRGVIWLETVVGFGVACYGLINHLVAIAVLYFSGLLKKESDRDKFTEWLWRGLVVLGCYAVEVFLVARHWGRRAAGYYAPSLPLSALYLWRYAWLLRHQTHFAFLASNLSGDAAKTRRLRKQFLQRINEALEQHAEMLALPH